MKWNSTKNISIDMQKHISLVTHCGGFAAIYPLRSLVIPHSTSQKSLLILTSIVKIELCSLS
jgi:hypothetical protein